MDDCRVLNLNVGVLGHVDSGKTSLVKALSTHLSTAALDKHPQSQQRGITLDLGFSAFVLEMPPHLQSHIKDEEFTHLQFTLVDCPGHASLIRTIIGGAQIIDLMVLVIDVVKGMQMQTGECLVIGEMTTDNLIVVLNKIDLLPEEEREKAIDRMEKRVRRALKPTKFVNCPVVAIAAAAGGEKVAAVGAEGGAGTKSNGRNAGAKSGGSEVEAWGVEGLVQVLQDMVTIPARSADGPMLFAVDHCFAIKGQGTVLTGTVLSGKMNVKDTIQLPYLGLERKIKSMQSFRRPVQTVGKGDRVGACVTSLDPKLVERTIACTPGSVPSISRALALVRGVKYFKGRCVSRGIFHVTLGHQTVMANAIFFGAEELGLLNTLAHTGQSGEGVPSSLSSHSCRIPDIEFNWNNEFLYQEELVKDTVESADSQASCPLQWCLLQFQTPVYISMKSLIIGSRLDMNEKQGCRIAFYGTLNQELVDGQVKDLRIYTEKIKQGVVHRVQDQYEVIGKDLFGKNANLHQFLGMRIHTKEGSAGIISGAFGESKFKIKFKDPVRTTAGKSIYLIFKKYIFDQMKQMHQDSSDEIPRRLLQSLTLESPFGEDVPIAESKAPKIPVSDKAEQGLKADRISEPSAVPTYVDSGQQSLPPKPPEEEGEVAKLETGNSGNENLKVREGIVDKMKGEPLPNGGYEVLIIANLFSIEENIKEYAGREVGLENVEKKGVILGPFGKAGKCKVSFEGGVKVPTGVPAWLLP